MRRALAVAALVLAGCPGPRRPEAAKAAEPFAITNPELRAQYVAELRSEILANYERDDPPELATSMLLPRVDAQGIPHPIGPVRVGVGPGDVLVADQLEKPPSRWPLDVPPQSDPRLPALTEARSKRLEIYLSQDGLSAWAFDEISWRVHLKDCPRTAAIPLRMTALYARTGDRWVLAFEHLSYARPPAPMRSDELAPRQFRSEVITKDLVDDLSRVVSPILYRKLDQIPKVIGTGGEVLLLGPDVTSEWHGADVLGAALAPGNMTLEDRLVGAIGPTLDAATIAYWVGNVTADLPSRGKARLRASFVFERRRRVTVEPGKAPRPLKGVERGVKNLRQDPEQTSCIVNDTNCDWVLVQGHVSAPISDRDLANTVFGTALISEKPLQIACDDGSRPAPR
ncbi:MAG: hypothetical protein KF773_25635 [Deltaproteobacteria bacterium]|nr:hypothetical protein [Deltaproteobacteria bacterium]